MAHDVRFGSKADICTAMGHVRFTPESGHLRCKQECPLWANSGHRATYSAQGFAFISIRMPWIVFPEALKTRPSGCGAMFTTKHPWPFQFWTACMTSRFGGS